MRISSKNPCQTFSFSTSRNLYKPTSEKPKSQNPSSPMSKLTELGANRTVKIVVIMALMIAGTAESIFWGKLLWAKFAPEDGKEDEGEGEGS